MAKKTARTRSVQLPKDKSTVSLQKIENAIRIVALELSPSSAKHAGKRSERAAAGHR